MRIFKLGALPKEDDLVQEFIEVLEAGFAFQQGVVDSMADKKIDWQDGFNFLPFLRKLPPAINGAEKVLNLFRNFSKEAKQKIMDYVGEHFDIEDDLKEELIEETINEILGDILIANKWAKYRKPVAA